MIFGNLFDCGRGEKLVLNGSCWLQLQDYWWVKALLDKEVKKIAKEAMEAAWEDGRRVERESYERQLRLIKEKNAKGQEAFREEEPEKGDPK